MRRNSIVILNIQKDTFILNDEINSEYYLIFEYDSFVHYLHILNIVPSNNDEIDAG